MKPVIQYPDFEKVDFRVGKIIAASAPEWSEKLLEFRVDFGAEIGEKTIFSGIKKFYEPGQFVGKKYIFVVNLEPRKMGEGYSQGMMIMVVPDEESAPMLINIDQSAPEGAILR